MLSPFGEVANPARMKKADGRLALSPHVNGWIEYDNTEGTEPVQLVFGVGDPDYIFRPLQDSVPNLVGFGLGTRFAYATTPGPHVEPRQDFSIFEPKFRDYHGLLLICGETALVFTVPAGQKKRFPLVLAFFDDSTVTSGITARYAYTRFFDSIEDVVAHGLSERRHYEKLAARRDRELERSSLDADQRFLVAQATHSYFGSTQLLWGKDGPLWVVNEGEYRMMNTFDLTVDHLFFELEWFPWAVRDVLELFASRYSYTDRIQLGAGRSAPGGISFTHDMGSYNGFTPKGRSSYECDHLRGCFSHMTMEQLLNWALCAVCYAAHTKGRKWLRAHRATLCACAESLRRRDNPEPRNRDGILKHDTLRVGTDGSEITTYDSLDVSLGQARNNLYLSVKTLGAWILLEHGFSLVGMKADSRLAAETADLLAATLVTKFDEDSGTFPAVFEANNQSRIIPAIEGLVYPLFLGLTDATNRKGRFAPLLNLLSRHLRTVLKPGICIDATSFGWKMSSTSTNTWFSKIAIAQHVVRRLFPEALSEAAAAADRVHAQWQRSEGCGAHAMCDQIRSDTGVTCGSRYYPRGVTSTLWFRE
ncbi:MAG: glycoside hydrolase family 52 protein [Polyangiaceae bacterium]